MALKKKCQSITKLTIKLPFSQVVTSPKCNFFLGGLYTDALGTSYAKALLAFSAADGSSTSQQTNSPPISRISKSLLSWELSFDMMIGEGAGDTWISRAEALLARLERSLPSAMTHFSGLQESCSVVDEGAAKFHTWSSVPHTSPSLSISN